MNNPSHPKWTIAASLALLALAGSASAGLIVTTANQNGAKPFTPTWTPSTNSLIRGVAPSATAGNFNLDNTNCNVLSLTASNISLTIDTVPGNNPAGPDPVGNTTTTPNYVTCGNRTAAPAAGSLLVYNLPASANGYNLTNISVYSGWADNGRDAQAYTVLYSTVSNPSNFVFLTNVAYNPTVTGGTPTSNRGVVSDSAGGVIAANVVAVKFVFATPQVENQWTGYGGITVEGTAAGSIVSPIVSITTSNESGVNPYTPTWTLETPNLIAGMAPTTATGTFTTESSGGTNVLTDGVIGQSGNVLNFATCGNGRTLIYTLTNVVNGSDVTNVVLYSGWGNADRDGQYFTLSYSTVAAPTTYVPVTTVFYNPIVGSGASANRVAIRMSNGSPLASAVANLKFDFSPSSANQFDNGYQGYSEIIVQGTDTAAPAPPPSPYLTQDTLPTRVETVVGDQVVFSAAYSNAPPANLQWLFISGGITNTIANATNTTLTLSNVQTNSSGVYTLKAVNATNGAAAPSFSTPSPLAVGIATNLGNVTIQYTAQAGPTNFYPAWIVDTNNDLIFGFPTDGSGNPGTATAGLGNYGLEAGLAGDPTILADGVLGNIKPLMVSCGPGGGAGLSMTYTLNTVTATNGFDLTNIVIYGGWPDVGRNEQKYQVLYSTVAAPTTFSSIGTFDYNPSFTAAEPNATRVTLVPVSGVLAQNVYAVQINWNLQGSQPKNGWEGYSEVTVGGAASAPKPVLTQDINPLTAEDVVGSSLTLTADFTGATSYQWQKDGTNISGANSPTLTLNNLQLSDTATNGGYRLTASNGAGTSFTRGCTLVVDPSPTAVNNIIVAFANQSSDAGSFSPTWDTSNFASSLISGGAPTEFGPGNFNDPDGNPVSGGLAGGIPVLTDSDYGSVINGGPHPAFATCGPNAGQYVTYTLPPSANGYDLTNIVIGSGWNDDGRSANWSTVLYSTMANPSMFFPLAVVTNRPILGAKTEVRATLHPASGVMASNVYAVKVDFESPAGMPNGYSGISQINVFGSPSAATLAGPVITVEHTETNNIWTAETPNLIGGQLPSTQGPGVFTGEGCSAAGMTDGILSFGGNANSSACGVDTNASVSFVTFNSASGWNLTNIVVYTLWHDFGRDGQFYNVSYSTLSSPATFVPLASVSYNPYVPHDGRATGNRVQIAPPVGQTLLASNVAVVKFDFTPQGSQDFSWSGYTEIIVQGTNLPSTTVNPPTLAAPLVSGGNLILTGSGGTAGASYTWLTATNITTPIANWTTNNSGNLDGNGAFSNSIPIDVTKPARFFRLRLP